MIKRTITETIEKYDKDGKVVEKTTRTETEEDDTNYTPSYPSYPSYPNTNPLYPWQWNPVEITCGTISTGSIALDNGVN